MNVPQHNWLDEALNEWRQWRPQPRSKPMVMRRLNGGLTNESWLVEFDTGLAVVRINSPIDRVLNIDRYRERVVLQAVSAAGIAPPVLYCRPEQRVLVVSYVEGETLEKKYRPKDWVAERMGALIERIQGLSVALPRFDYWQHLLHYEHWLQKYGLSIPDKLQKLKNCNLQKLMDFQNAPWEPVLVHHDLCLANIIDCQGTLMVIDWEYAGYGHGSWDFAPWKSASVDKNSAIELYRQLINGYWQLLHTHLPPGGEKWLSS